MMRQVFSDEFETEGRSFEDGEDPKWTAINKNDCKFSIIYVNIFNLLVSLNLSHNKYYDCCRYNL